MNMSRNATSRGRGRAASLRLRVGLVVSGAMVAITLLFYFVLSALLENYFGDLQDDITASRLQEVAIIINDEARARVRLTKEQAERDEAWNFLAGTNPDYLRTNYLPGTRSEDQHVVLVFDRDKKLVAAMHSTDGGRVYTAPTGLDVKGLAEGLLLGAGSTAGLARDEHGALLLTAHPVLHSDLSGPSNGWLLLGFYLNPDRFTEIDEMAGARTTLAPVERVPDETRPNIIKARKNTAYLGRVNFEFPKATRVDTSEERLSGTLSFPSVEESAPVEVEVSFPLHIYRDAVNTKHWFIALSCLGGILVMAIGFAAFEVLVIKPLAALDARMQKMAASPDALGYLEVRRNDEIGRLAESANSLLGSIMAGRRELEERNVLLDGVLNSAAEGVAAFRLTEPIGGEADLEFVLLNHAAERSLDLEVLKVIGHPVREVAPGLAGTALYRNWLEAARSRQAVVFEAPGRGESWWHSAVAIWKDGLVVTFKDISERKHRELALAESYQDARQSERAAAEANVAKTTFLAMMSHEIRTPLNGVIGFTDLLLAEGLPVRQSEIAQGIKDCGETLLGIISEILDLSKIESGRIDLAPEQTDVAASARSVLTAFEQAAREKGLTLELKLGEALPSHLWLDPNRFRQILFNLVGNALKFTRQGGIVVSLRAEPQEKGWRLWGEVHDTGSGIAPADLETIFDPFQQGEGARREATGGAGLGLAICRRLVEAMGGEITVKSVLGEGSEFRFFLELGEGVLPADGGAAETGAFPRDRAGAMKVLVVDDVGVNVRLAQSMLEKLGFHPEAASSGVEAVRKAQETDYDLIFLDVLMPGMDGYEATRAIRAGRDGARPWIVAITADVLPENQQRCREAGMDDFLTKPLRIRDFEAALARWQTKG